MIKHKILVVEDDDFFREAICDLLKKKYDVLSAPNGKAAKDIILMQDFNLVLSDIQMPGLSGIELLEWCQQNKPTPFVMMTGFSMALETKSAHEMGAKGFIAKPFKNNELFAIINEVLGTEEKTFEVVTPVNEYCKVSIDEFVSRPKVDFDVFIKLSEAKTIKLAHKGEEIPKDKINSYKEKGVKFLHILKEDFGRLVEFNLNVAKIIQGRSDISKEKKFNFIKYTGEVILEKIFVNGLDKTSFTEAQSFLNMSMSAITEGPGHLDLLSALTSHSDEVYAHSLGVALYSVMIAKKLGYESNTVLFKLSTAGLYHDIGKKEIEREILDKPRHLLSTVERKLIESHVSRGQEILMAMPGISEDIIRLVFEHHEDLSGLGFPMRKVSADLHPLSKILQLANVFMNQAVNTAGGMTGPGAIAHIERVYDTRLDAKCVAALKALFL